MVLREVLRELHQVVLGDEADLSRGVPGLEPIWIRGGTVDDLKPFTLNISRTILGFG